MYATYIIYIINISLITEQRKLINTKRVQCDLNLDTPISADVGVQCDLYPNVLTYADAGVQCDILQHREKSTELH